MIEIDKIVYVKVLEKVRIKADNTINSRLKYNIRERLLESVTDETYYKLSNLIYQNFKNEENRQ